MPKIQFITQMKFSFPQITLCSSHAYSQNPSVLIATKIHIWNPVLNISTTSSFSTQTLYFWGQMGIGAYDELLDVGFGIASVWMFGLQIWMSKLCFSSEEREQMLHPVIFCWFSSRQEHSTMFLYLSVTWIRKELKD